MKSTWLVGLGVVLALVGCGRSAVRTTEPVGIPIWSEMQGVWEGYGDIYHVRLLPDGSLPVARVDWDVQADEFKLAKGELIISVDEGRTYANLSFPEVPGGKRLFEFYRVFFVNGKTRDRTPGNMAFFMPINETFANAVRSDALEGEVEDASVVLTDAKSLADFIDPEKFSEQFEALGGGYLVRRIQDGREPHGLTVLDAGRQAHMECIPLEIKQRAMVLNDQKIHESMIEMMKSQGASAEFVNKLEAELEAKKLQLEAEGLDQSEPEELMNEGIIDGAVMSATDFSSYLRCLETQGFRLINAPAPFPGHFWVAKNGFGLFSFFVLIK